MKVYIICHQAEIWEDSCIEGVYATEALANAECDKLQQEFPYDRIMACEWEVINYAQS